MDGGKQIFEKGEPNGKSVGIVGSGPAGLSCATYLARLGYDVTIYERQAQAGGLDTYGMAEYKMPQSVSLSEVEHIAGLGVKFMLNTEIVAAGTGDPEVLGEVNRVSFDLLKEWHDVVFLAVGLHKIVLDSMWKRGDGVAGFGFAVHFGEGDSGADGHDAFAADEAEAAGFAGAVDKVDAKGEGEIRIVH